MTDQINQKLNSSFDKEQDRVLVAGMYGYNSTSGKFNYANIDDNGDLKVNIHATGGGGDLKARSDIADPATSTFLKCNTNGTLEMTAELSSAGLATSAIQTDGTQKTQILGNTSADGTGDTHHIHCDGNGNLKVINVSSVNVLPANTVNSGITNDPANSVAVGLRGRTTITDSSTETFLKCDTDGHLQIDTAGTLTITGDTQIKAENDSGSATNIRCNNSGHVKSACIGAESDGTLRQIQTNEVGQLKTKLIADDGATRREVRCNNSGQLEVAIVSGGGGGGTTTHTLEQQSAATGAIQIIGDGNGNQYIDTNGGSKFVVVVQTGDGSGSPEISVEWSDNTSFSVNQVFVCNGFSSGIALISALPLQSTSRVDFSTLTTQAIIQFETIPARYARITVRQSSGSAITYTGKTTLSP